MSLNQVEWRELWRQRVAQQDISGQSIREFCRERALSEPAFYGLAAVAADWEPGHNRAGGDEGSGGVYGPDRTDESQGRSPSHS